MTEPEHDDVKLVDRFLDQPNRNTYSCFSWANFALVFDYGTTVQKCAVRQALLSCLALPQVDTGSAISARHLTFERHLHNWVLHILKRVARDHSVPIADRRLAASVAGQTLLVKEDAPQKAAGAEIELHLAGQQAEVIDDRIEAFPGIQPTAPQQEACLEIPAEHSPALAPEPFDEPDVSFANLHRQIVGILKDAVGVALEEREGALEQVESAKGLHAKKS
jgi:hypothetical protein